MHLPTLFIVSALIDLCLGVLLAYSRARRGPGTANGAAGSGAALGAWGAVLLAASAGMALGALGSSPVAADRGWLPEPDRAACAIASDAARLLAGGLMWRAARATSGHPFRAPLALLPPLGWLLLLGVLALLDDRPAARALAYCVVSAGAVSAAALTMWRDKRPPMPAARLLTGLLLLHAGVTLVRGGVAAWTLFAAGAGAANASWAGPGGAGAGGAGLPGGVQSEGLAALFLLEITLFLTGLGCAALALAKERAEAVGLRGLTQARDAACAAAEARVHFLGRVGHELRTPLHGMLGMAEQLRADPALPPSLAERAHMLGRAGEHLRRLVDDLLDLARIDSGRVPIAPRPVRLAQMFADCLAIVRGAAGEKSVRLELSCAQAPDAVLADRTRVQQILLNLLSNAIRFSPPGGLVRLIATVPRDGALLLEVRDEGPGVPEARRAALFTSWALRPPSGGPAEALPVVAPGGPEGVLDGAGLGLAICHALAQAMGGQIGYRRTDHVSCFWVDLPLPAIVPAGAAVAAPAAPRPRWRDPDPLPATQPL